MLQQYLWNIIITPAVGWYNIWAKRRRSGCLPLGKIIVRQNYEFFTSRYSSSVHMDALISTAIQYNPALDVRKYYLTVNLLHFVGFRATEMSQEMKMLIVQQKMLYQKHSLRIFKIQPFTSSLWEERWDKVVDNKLHAIMPQIDEYYSGCRNRKDEIINRLRTGHTRLTHSFRMENRPHPPLRDQCEGDHELTVKHILIECSFLKIIRWRHYAVTDLNQLFKTVSSKRILDFVKDIGLYNSL